MDNLKRNSQSERGNIGTARDIIARETRALSLASLGAPVNTLGKFALFCFQIKFAMLSVVLLLPHTEPRDASDSAWVSEGTPSYSVSGIVTVE